MHLILSIWKSEFVSDFDIRNSDLSAKIGMRNLDENIVSVLDANFGRLDEGLRVLEDTCRFVLKNLRMTREFKKMRHFLTEASCGLKLQLLNSRGRDIGASLILANEGARQGIDEIVIANAKRAEESLRVLEEYFKFLKIERWRKFQEKRFLLYSLEKEIVSKIVRKEKTKRLFPLCLILDAKYLKKEKPIEKLKEAISGGVKAVQYRDKTNSKRRVLKNAVSFRRLCQRTGVLFLINDYLDIALAVDSDGVHLGDKDLPVRTARKMLPFDKIIGRTVHSLKEAEKAQADGADYLSLGALFPSRTKKDASLIEPLLIKRIKEKIDLPIMAIGGINKNNVKKTAEWSADGVAVSEAIMAEDNCRRAAKEILSEIKKLTFACL